MAGGDDDAEGPIVVALTASAGGAGSLEALLRALPPQPDAALVAVLQHRERLDEERFWRAASAGGHRRAALDHDAPVEPGRLYLPGPGLIVTLEDGHFRTRPAGGASDGGRGVIDSFLVSLARARDGRSVAVALAGTDGDGTLGLREVKDAGGMTLAEDTPESRAGALDASDGPAALADAVLPVEALVPRLAALVAQLAAERGGPSAPEAAQALADIAASLRSRTGHDFHGYKPGTFQRRVQRRMQFLGLEDVRAYLGALRASPDEARSLFNDLLIGVTDFFRDPREWEALEAEVVPRLFEGREPRDPVRVWVAGCSTGEEAYSLAILLAEARARLDDPPPVQVFASDLDGRALAQARAARYPDTIASRMGPERLGRWFVREGDTFRVAKELREMCVFSQHSLIKDAPFSRLDLVSCRNLLIYLGAELQERVIPIFHFALRPGGFLFLGSSENVSRHAGLFAPLGGRSRIFRRLDAATRSLPDFSFATADRRPLAVAAPAEAATPGPRRADGGDLARQAERAVERHAPAHVIVDGAQTVLHFSGNMGRFLAPSGGAASLNLLALVNPALRADLRTALATAEAEGRAAEARGLEVTVEGARRGVDLVVEPLPPGADGRPGFVVIFKDAILKDVAPRREGAGGSDPEQAERPPDLVDELRATRDRLRATVEELETTNEEMKSSNEEYQSLNEELQSANEELETSKEEMQSLNEELTTVNGELAHRVHELGRANSDLKNFLEATQIATLFLDNELRVTNFTPATGELFHLVESDLGRPIAHVRPRVAYDELADDARRVLRTLQPVEREVEASGARFMARVLPYRSTDNYIAGVVLTFTDVTVRRELEERQAFLLRLSDALRPLADPVAITETATRLLGERLGASRAYYAEWPPGADHGEIARDYARPGLPSLAGRYPIEAFRTAYDRVSQGTTWIVEDNSTAEGIGDGERAYHQEAGVIAWVDVPLIKDGQPRAVLCVVQDRPRRWAAPEVALIEDTAERLWAAVERARAEKALRASEERLQLALDAAGMGTFVWHVAEDRTEADARAYAHVGLPPDATVTLAEALVTTFHPDDAPVYAAAVARALDPAGPGTLHEEYRSRGPDGQERWMSVSAVTAFEGTPPAPARMTGVLANITERKRAEASLRDSEERFRAIVETARDHAIFTTDPEGRIETWPPGAQEVFGWTAEEAVGRLVDMTFTPEDRAAGAPEEERRAAREDGQAANVRWHLRKDGARVFIEGVTRPLRGTGGALTGFVKVGQDVTERRATEDALRESELRFRTLSEGIPQLVWTAVDHGSWTWASPQWTAFTGQPEADSHGWGWLDTLHPDDHEAARAAWERSKATGAFEADYRLREGATGEFRWFQTRATPVRDEDGAIVEWLGTCTDVQDLREMQERQGVLVAELQHRTRNLMGVVRAVTDRTIEGSRSLPDFHARIRDRLGALARVNGLLSRLHEGRRITFDELIRVELRGHGVIDGEGRGRQVELDGPAGVRLRSSTVQTLALGLHELATNALKYGALSRPEGRLRVGWDVVDGADGARRLRVDWRESGVAVPATGPDGGAPRRGYGRELIERALPYQLKAETTYELTPGGVRCTITLPVSAPASPGGGEDLPEGDA